MKNNKWTKCRDIIHRSIVTFSMLFCFVAINTRCVCIFHQPKMPDNMKKRFNNYGKYSK